MDGLDTACRLLRDEAEDSWRLRGRAATLADTVAWESPAAEAFRRAVADVCHDAELVTALLEQLAATAVELRNDAFAQMAQIANPGR